MARESCNLDKDEAEIRLKPSSSSPPPPPPSSPPKSAASPPNLFLHHRPLHRRVEDKAQEPVPEPELPTAKRKREEEEEEEEDGRNPAVRPVSRCSSCRRKVGLTGFRCRCGELFCSRHRYSDTHDCSFDYKAIGREEIAKANPVIRAAKIIKI